MSEEYSVGYSEGYQAGWNAAMDATPPAQPAPVQDLPFGVGGGLVAIKTLLSRDPCVHANTAIEMIDAILKEHTAAQHEPENEPYVSLASVQEPVAWMFDCGNGGRMYAEDLDASVGWLPLYTTPPAQPSVPDAIHHTDLSEHPQYIEGWNDYRAAMLEMMK